MVRRMRTPSRLGVQLAELSLAAPEVIMRRVRPIHRRAAANVRRLRAARRP